MAISANRLELLQIADAVATANGDSWLSWKAWAEALKAEPR